MNSINFNDARILVVVAHPDDELLGLGGAMHHLIKNKGCNVEVIVLGEGITSRADNRDTQKWKGELKEHKENVKRAKDIIGYENVILYDFPDNRFDSVDLLDIVKVIETEKKRFKPDIIFTHHGGDLNIDHQRTFEAVITATRPMKGECVKSIITFETPSGTEWQAPNTPFLFTPNMYIELMENDVNAKISAMECYEFEKRSYPHPRSPEALKLLAQYRGTTVGVEFAEAFMICRTINRL